MAKGIAGAGRGAPRAFRMTPRIGNRTARRKHAPLQIIKLARNNARDRGQNPPCCAFGQGCEQGCGLGVVRIAEQAARLLHLDLLSGVLHNNTLRRFGDHAHIMGDQNQTHAVFVPEPEQ